MAQNIYVYVRADSSKGTLTDSANNPVSTQSEVVLHTATEIVMRLYKSADATDYYTKTELDVYDWNFYADDDYQSSTDPKIGTQDDIYSDDDGYLHIPIDTANESLIEWLGSDETKNIHCELQGYGADDEVEFLVQFDMTVRNRVFWSGSYTPSPVEGMYWTRTESDARYLRTANVYTQAQADAKFATIDYVGGTFQTKLPFTSGSTTTNFLNENGSFAPVVAQTCTEQAVKRAIGATVSGGTLLYTSNGSFTNPLTGINIRKLLGATVTGGGSYLLSQDGYWTKWNKVTISGNRLTIGTTSVTICRDTHTHTQAQVFSWIGADVSGSTRCLAESGNWIDVGGGSGSGDVSMQWWEESGSTVGIQLVGQSISSTVSMQPIRVKYSSEGDVYVIETLSGSDRTIAYFPYIHDTESYYFNLVLSDYYNGSIRETTYNVPKYSSFSLTQNLADNDYTLIIYGTTATIIDASTVNSRLGDIETNLGTASAVLQTALNGGN